MEGSSHSVLPDLSQLLDFDEEDLQIAIRDSLQDASSVERDEEKFYPNQFPVLHSSMFDAHRSSTQTREWDSSQTLLLDKPSSSVVAEALFGPSLPICRPFDVSNDLTFFEESYEALGEEVCSSWATMPVASNDTVDHLDPYDSAREMQALRARMDILQSRLPPSRRPTSLESNAFKGERNMSQLQESDYSNTTQVTDYCSFEPESRTWTFNIFNKHTAVGNTPAYLLDSHSTERGWGVPTPPTRSGQLNAFSIQNQRATATTPEFWNTSAVADATRLHQPALWWYHQSRSGEKFLHEHSYLSSRASSQSSWSLTPQEPQLFSKSVSPWRGASYHSIPAAEPDIRQPGVDFWPKRRRVMPNSNMSQSSRFSQPQRWDEFALNAFASQDNRRLITSPDRFRDWYHSGSASTGTRGQYQCLQDGPVLGNNTFVPFMPGPNIIFLSQLLPTSFSYSKRVELLSIIRAEAAYLPLCVLELDMSKLRPSDGEANNGAATTAKQQRQFKHPFGRNGNGWPTNCAFDEKHTRLLPVEIFEMIGSHLPRDSIQSMRLVNREFESKISCFAFKSVVVPFKQKIYETSIAQPSTLSAKSQGKQKETHPSENNSERGFPGFSSIMNTYNPKESHVKDGMRVFEEWGPEIKKFALTFEVAEDNLTNLKPKTKFEIQSTFWGSFKWPHSHYSRYEQVAKLEQKADETSAMTAAFSKLIGIRELGLSVLSGLGWLSGRDVSDRARLFRKKPFVFGNQHKHPDRELRENIEKWEAIISDSSKPFRRTAAGCYFDTGRELSSVNNMPRIVFKDTTSDAARQYPPLIFDSENLEAKDQSVVVFREDEGVDPPPYIHGNTSVEPSRVVPNELTPEQEDWLMEMEWAQQAFLSSWCLALLDNPTIFHSLRVFIIANLSSKYISSLQRNDVWRALPCLENLTMLVSPDWRQVLRDAQGNIYTRPIHPTDAQTRFWTLLDKIFAWNNSIKTLKIGFVDGGEHATGMFARNRNILPAPIDRIPYNPQSWKQSILKLPHIENLTLTNCWLAPSTLISFFTNHQAPNLKTMTFDSVSLTAPTGSRTGVNDDDDDNDNSIQPTVTSDDRSLDWLAKKPRV
ncbi:MAG: hypothetical protein Q9182_002300 [Xanthomendoza sp. 2 TL-2023]